MSPTPPDALIGELPESAQTSRLRASFLAFLVALFFSRLADQVLLFVVPLVVFQVT